METTNNNTGSNNRDNQEIRVNNTVTNESPEERNTTDSRDVQPSATIGELIGGDEKAEEIKHLVEQDEAAENEIEIETSEVEDEQYPKNP